MKICICGDSFASNIKGWPRLLNHQVSNHSQNGVGEYKILQQVLNASKNYDKIIICHTSPWRIHTQRHPIHIHNPQRQLNDFMLNDLEHHKSKSKEVKNIVNYIKSYTDWKYVKDMYDLIVERLSQLPNAIHITFHDPEDTKQILNNFHDVWQKYPGDINHLNILGNEIVAKRLKKLLQ